MRVRTETELGDWIDGNLARRKKELADLKGLITRSSGSRQTAVCRAGLVLLYAHWEGFIAEAAQAYVEYVNRRRLTRDQLATHFIATAVELRIAASGSMTSRGRAEDLVEFTRGKPLGPLSIDRTQAIRDRGNLNSKVLNEIASVIGVDVSCYDTKSKLIDETLVGGRNKVAHGEQGPDAHMSADDLSVLHAAVIEMLDTFRDKILDAARKGTYRIA